MFSDSNISSDHLVSLYPNGKLDGYASNARFFKTGDGAYTMPTLSVKRQYVNYGTYNDWEGSTDPSEDLEDFTNDAESIVGKFSVKNDTVTFYNGNGQTYQLAEGNNFVEITQIPSFPPEAELTYAGIFDSANTTPEGITVEPETNNGHHETCSIAYYKQIQVIPTEKCVLAIVSSGETLAGMIKTYYTTTLPVRTYTTVHTPYIRDL